MLAILNSLNAHNLPIFQPILVIPVSKFIVHRVLSDETYLSLGLLSHLSFSCLLSDKNDVCSFTDSATMSSATVLLKVHETWPLQ